MTDRERLEAVAKVLRKAGFETIGAHRVAQNVLDAIRAFDEERNPTSRSHNWNRCTGNGECLGHPHDCLGHPNDCGCTRAPALAAAAQPPSEAEIEAALDAWYRAARDLNPFTSQDQMRTALIAAAKARAGG